MPIALLKISSGDCQNIVSKTSFRTIAEGSRAALTDLKSGRQWDRLPELHCQGQCRTKEHVWVPVRGKLLMGSLVKCHLAGFFLKRYQMFRITWL